MKFITNYLIVNQACADILVFLTSIEKDFNAPYVPETNDRLWFKDFKRNCGSYCMSVLCIAQVYSKQSLQFPYPGDNSSFLYGNNVSMDLHYFHLKGFVVWFASVDSPLPSFCAFRSFFYVRRKVKRM